MTGLLQQVGLALAKAVARVVIRAVTSVGRGADPAPSQAWTYADVRHRDGQIASATQHPSREGEPRG